MNGRIYDPQLGRFLSADKYIQSPLNLQSYNRYSYVFNNPLKYTDPSGDLAFVLAIPVAWEAGVAIAAVVSTYLAATPQGRELTSQGIYELGQAIDSITSSDDPDVVGMPESVVTSTAPQTGFDLEVGSKLSADLLDFESDATPSEDIVGKAEVTTGSDTSVDLEFPIAKEGNTGSIQDKTSNPVHPGERGTYGELKARKKANGETEPMDMDHRPSYAAQKRNLEKQLGRELTPSEAKALKDSTPAVATPRDDHQQKSRTYGGRNTKAQIEEDAADLEKARRLDEEAMR